MCLFWNRIGYVLQKQHRRTLTAFLRRYVWIRNTLLVGMPEILRAKRKVYTQYQLSKNICLYLYLNNFWWKGCLFLVDTVGLLELKLFKQIRLRSVWCWYTLCHPDRTWQIVRESKATYSFICSYKRHVFIDTFSKMSNLPLNTLYTLQYRKDWMLDRSKWT